MLGLKTTQNSTFSKIDSKYFSSINQFHSIYLVKSSVAVRFGKTSFDRTTEPHRTSPNCWFDRTTEPNRKVRSYTISFTKGHSSLVSILVFLVGTWPLLVVYVEKSLGKFYSFNLHVQIGVSALVMSIPRIYYRVALLLCLAVLCCSFRSVWAWLRCAAERKWW